MKLNVEFISSRLKAVFSYLHSAKSILRNGDSSDPAALLLLPPSIFVESSELVKSLLESKL